MEKEIKDLTKEELLNVDNIYNIYYSASNEDERKAIKNELIIAAKQYNMAGYMKTNLNKLQYRVEDVGLTYDKNGMPESTIDNIVTILENDNEIKPKFAYNLLSHRPVKICEDGSEKPWSDSDDSELQCYMETRYGIYNTIKYFNGFNIACSHKQYNPIKELIENKPWDGTPRIDRFLVDILKSDDTNYSREASRMIFYGGISRLYHPGCKFDYMPILISEQGKGKSTIVKWLALNDKYYADLSTIEGKDALENIQGMWICELSELVAMVRSKEVESMKSFISRTVDHFRESYGRRTNDYPRTCIFIGTTNDTQFLYDKTGNRRYLPINMKTSANDIFGREDYIRNYILECWREALYLLNQDKVYLTIPVEYYDEVLNAQNSAVEDDPRIGIVIDYLNDKEIDDKVCTVEIFTKCFNGLKKNFTRIDAKEIARILSNQKDWERSDTGTFRFPEYGTQRYWKKISLDNPITEKENKWSDLD